MTAIAIFANGLVKYPRSNFNADDGPFLSLSVFPLPLEFELLFFEDLQTPGFVAFVSDRPEGFCLRPKDIKSC